MKKTRRGSSSNERRPAEDARLHEPTGMGKARSAGQSATGWMISSRRRSDRQFTESAPTAGGTSVAHSKGGSRFWEQAMWRLATRNEKARQATRAREGKRRTTS